MGRSDDKNWQPSENAVSQEDSILHRAEALRQRDSLKRIEAEREQKAWREENRKRRVRKFVASHRKFLTALWVVPLVVFSLLMMLYLFFSSYEVKSIRVMGNTMYTDEEIINRVCEGPFGRNSLYLSLKYRDKEVKDIAFIEKLTVSIDGKDQVNIRVYEKALAGYIDYLGNHMYFDSDGTIVEASDRVMEGVPLVNGLVFDHVVLGERLPVKNPQIFDRILDIAQLLTKYGLSIDRIYFDEKESLTMFSHDIRVDIGGTDFIDEKLSNLSHILPNLEGESGVIDLRDFTPDKKSISFRKK